MLPVLKIEIGQFPVENIQSTPEDCRAVFTDMLQLLGIDADVDITTTSNRSFITINNRICGFPGSLIKQAEDYLLLKEKAGIQLNHAKELSELILRQIIWLQASVLLPEGFSVAAYMPALLQPALAGDKTVPKKCSEIIAELLDLKISLVQKSVIAGISDKYLNAGVINWHQFREELIDALFVAEVTVFVRQDYFDSTIVSASGSNFFELMREGLFYENGIVLPSFKILFDNSLPPGAFCFRINEFVSIPMAGLSGNDVRLVNDTPERLKLIGIDGSAAINPANGMHATLISNDDYQKAESNGLTTWNGLGYFILCFSSWLRKNGYLCITQRLVQQYMPTVELVSPHVKVMAENTGILPLTVKVLRLLAKEEISIRDFRLILEAIMESDCITGDGYTYIIFDDRIPVEPGLAADWKNEAENITEFVRTKLKRYITNKYSGGNSSFAVYMLDQEIEQIINADFAPFKRAENEMTMKIQDAVTAKMGGLPASTQPPVILTSVTARRRLKNAIGLQHPGLPIISYQELSPSVSIQPIAKISFIE